MQRPAPKFDCTTVQTEKSQACSASTGAPHVPKMARWKRLIPESGLPYWHFFLWFTVIQSIAQKWWNPIISFFFSQVDSQARAPLASVSYLQAPTRACQVSNFFPTRACQVLADYPALSVDRAGGGNPLYAEDTPNQEFLIWCAPIQEFLIRCTPIQEFLNWCVTNQVCISSCML